MLFYFVLFLFDFFSRTIIVIFHKTFAHFKIWDYDFFDANGTIFSNSSPQGPYILLRKISPDQRATITDLLLPFLEDLSPLIFHDTPLLFLFFRIPS